MDLDIPLYPGCPKKCLKFEEVEEKVYRSLRWVPALNPGSWGSHLFCFGSGGNRGGGDADGEVPLDREDVDVGPVLVGSCADGHDGDEEARDGERGDPDEVLARAVEVVVEVVHADEGLDVV